MAEGTEITAYLHIKMGPPSDYIHYEGKILTGNSIEMNSKTKLVIGRNPQIVNFQIFDLADDSSVSRVHCALYYDAKLAQFVLTDENSSNGTYINGDRINPYEPRPLRHNDEIELG